MEPEDDASLWQAALRGDGRAFGILFDRHHDRVFRHVVGLVEQSHDADEVAASAFLELWRCRDRVRVVGDSILPWLLVTAGNLARNEFRRARRYRRLLMEFGEQPGRTRRDPDLEVGARRDLVVALKRLRPIDAQVLVLAAELPMAEVGEALGISPATARVRLHRARERLRRLLDEKAGDMPVEEER